MLENRETDPPFIEDILWSPIVKLSTEAQKLLEKRRNGK